MSILEILVLTFVLYYGVRAATNLVRATRQDAGGAGGMDREVGERPWESRGGRSAPPGGERKPARRRHAEADIEDARWVDLD